MSSIDICVLADPYLRDCDIRALVHAIDELDVTISLVIVNEPIQQNIDQEAAADAVNENIGLQTVKLFWDVLKKERFWTFVIAEQKLLDQFSTADTLEEQTPVEEVSCFQDAEIKRVQPIRDGNWNELPPEIVSQVEDRCDVAVRYGFGLLRGDILSAPEWGVLSFHPADIRRYRGLGPPQAYLDGRETIGVTLQRLTDEVDAGEIIAFDEAEIAKTDTLWDIYPRVHDVQVELLAKGLSQLSDPDFEPTVPDEMGPYYSTKRRRKFSFSVRILLKNFRRRLR
ncbi:formyltransferase family protein [Halovenus rubra]|uniref:Formyltransferase family protein n=2 Tax=Halovenus rubra TaxID=869890 RepID=A0ABD5X8W0_9EURY|nr:formyltransferase family protein [Halovenus rubra]